MKSLIYDSIHDLAESMSEILEYLDEFEAVTAVAKYDEARELLSELIGIGHDIACAEFHQPEWEGYDAEYVLSLDKEGIWIEPFMREEKYLTDESEVTIVLDNCSSKCLAYCKGNLVFDVTIRCLCEEECPCSCECCEHCEHCERDLNDNFVVECTEDENDEIHGFTASKSDGNSHISYSFYTTDVLGQKEISEMLNRFGF